MYEQDFFAIERIHQLLWIPSILFDGSVRQGCGHKRRVHIELDEPNLVLRCETR